MSAQGHRAEVPGIRLIDRIPGGREPDAHLTLCFEDRQKNRLRARLDDGREVAVVLESQGVMRGGDHLGGDGLTVEVRAAEENVSMVSSSDSHLLARACYHLGNRHVPLDIRPGEVAYQRDHVLDEMVRGLGLTVEHVARTFEPEAGAYGAHEHR
ncbi:urease accessory protein UreE [Myxococcota bacterium]|nr:urease accessory protein UreE [Myxococcota bacterium]